MPSRIDPAAATNAFARQVQLGAQMRADDQSEQMNALALNQARRADAAAARNEAYDPQAFPKVGAIATQISQIQDPAQKRAAFKQAILANGPLFDTMGMPHADALAKVDQLDDDGVDATLTKLSSFAPKAPLEKVGAGDSLVSRDPATGAISTAYTAPAKPATGDDGAFSLSPGQQRFDKNGRRIASVAAAPPTDQNKFQDAQNLRKEFDSQSKEFRGVADSYQRILDSAKNPSPAGDLSLIFNYMKVLDPGSTVREGEFATAQNAGNVGDRVIGLYNRLLNGERLSTDQRADFVGRSTSLYRGQEGRFNSNVRDRFVSLANRYGFDPQEIVGGVTTKVPTEALPQKNDQGWALMTDAKGNRAYVSPDGKQFQEVP